MSTKIRPNDPCPCGSGKKYKKCHRGQEPIGGRAKQYNIRFRFHPDSANRIWNIGGTKILPTGDFDQLCEISGVSIAEVQQRVAAIHKLMNELGALRDSGNYILDYSNQNTIAAAGADNLPLDFGAGCYGKIQGIKCQDSLEMSSCLTH